MQQHLQARQLVRRQPREVLCCNRFAIGCVIGVAARNLETGDVGKVLRQGRLAEAAQEFRKAGAVADQHRRAWRMSCDEAQRKGAKRVGADQPDDDGKPHPEHVEQARGNIVAIDGKAAGRRAARRLADLAARRRRNSKAPSKGVLRRESPTDMILLPYAATRRACRTASLAAQSAPARLLRRALQRTARRCPTRSASAPAHSARPADRAPRPRSATGEPWASIRSGAPSPHGPRQSRPDGSRRHARTERRRDRRRRRSRD